LALYGWLVGNWQTEVVTHHMEGNGVDRAAMYRHLQEGVSGRRRKWTEGPPKVSKARNLEQAVAIFKLTGIAAGGARQALERSENPRKRGSVGEA
jgi:hypothetical protein